MAKGKKKGKGKGGSGMPKGFNEVISGVKDWNDDFHGYSDDAIDWSQNNPYGEAALPWIQGMLGGDMSSNPWMSRLYADTEGLNMDDGLGYLRDFLEPSDGGKGGGLWGNTGGSSRNSFRYSSDRGGTGPSTSPRGGVPDSTVGKGWFSEHINDLFDPERLDPNNDPTFKPMVDAYNTEALEQYYSGVTDLVNQAEAGGRYGTGMYQAQRAQAFDEFSEANAQAYASMAQHARDQAIQNQMEAMGLVNTRDIAEGNINAQLAAARMSANASGASTAAAAADAAEGRRLQAIQMMLGAGEFGMGLQGNMAQLMQQGQLGALQGGLGFGQLGMMGYDAAQGFGQLGLNAMGTMGNIYQGAASNRLQQQQMAENNRRYNEQAPIRDISQFIDIMNGLNDLGGYNDMPGYTPGQGPSPDGFNWDDILGSLLGGGAGYLAGQK